MPDLTSIRKQEAYDGNTVTYSDSVPVNEIVKAQVKQIQVDNEKIN